MLFQHTTLQTENKSNTPQTLPAVPTHVIIYIKQF